MEPDNPYYTLLAKYLADELDPAERTQVEHWLASDERNRLLFEELKQIWQSESEENWDVIGARQNVWSTISRMEGAARSAPDRKPVPMLSRRRTFNSRILGALVVICIVSVSLLFSQKDETEQSVWKSVAAENGQVLRVQLTDGSRVVLNAGSTLRYPESFVGLTKRTVFLEGEGYFAVSKNDRVPFEVHAGGAITRVLGTEFIVSNYLEERGVTVAVREGLVELRSESLEAGSGAQIKAGQLGKLELGSAVMIDSLRVPALAFGWLDQRLVFENTPLPIVAARISRWYDIDAMLTDSSLNALRLTATFDRESADQALSVIARTLDINITIEGKSVRFSSQ